MSTVIDNPCRLVQQMPRMSPPRVCVRCSHITCVEWRRQSVLPCVKCGQPIAPGERFFVNRMQHGFAIEQEHETCGGGR